MKFTFLGILLMFSVNTLISQDTEEPIQTNKGKISIYWGWNRSWYTDSDINFSGTDYNFTLIDVEANDRQTPFALDPYFNPVLFTIPQYNFRLGYFIDDKWEISFGVDHMKYVMLQDQSVLIDGTIQNSQTAYDGQYERDAIRLTSDFLKFEHTDGLNYGNIELRYFDKLFEYKILKFNYLTGAGFGLLVPKTNTTLLNNERYDEFHLAGFGIGAVAGINLTFWNHVYLQSEFKVGYINMPDIRTTMNKTDKANQDFMFSQINIVFGYIFRL